MYRMSVIDDNQNLIGAVNKVLDTFYIDDVQKQEEAIMIKEIEDALPIVQEQFLKDLLLGQYTEKLEIIQRAKFLKIDIQNSKEIRILSLDIKEFEKFSNNISISKKYLIPYSIKKIINAFSNGNQKFYAIQNTDNNFAVIILSVEELNSDANNDLMKTITGIYNTIEEKLGLITMIGVSGKSTDIIEIPLLYQQSRQAIQIRTYKNINLYSELDGKITDKTFDNKVNLEVLYKMVRELLVSGSGKDFNNFLDTYFNCEKEFQTQVLFKSIMIINVMEISLLDMGKSYKAVFDGGVAACTNLSSFKTIGEVKQWLYNIYTAIKTYLRDGEKSRDQKIVDDIKDIIRKNYQEQLTVNDIVEKIYLSPSQANNIFKKQVGKTIFDYLTVFRMEKAKELLRDPYSKIYLVADSVGYINKSHFCFLFNKYTGVTPGEYKKQGCTIKKQMFLSENNWLLST